MKIASKQKVNRIMAEIETIKTEARKRRRKRKTEQDRTTTTMIMRSQQDGRERMPFLIVVTVTSLRYLRLQ